MAAASPSYRHCSDGDGVAFIPPPPPRSGLIDRVVHPIWKVQAARDHRRIRIFPAIHFFVPKMKFVVNKDSWLQNTKRRSRIIFICRLS